MSDRNHDGLKPGASGVLLDRSAARRPRLLAQPATVLLVLLCVPIIGSARGTVQSAPQAPDPEPRLRERISAYWQAMQQEDYKAATLLVHPDSRDVFEHKVPKSRIEKWRIQKLEWNGDQTACDATIMVSKPVAIFDAALVEWPLRNQWVLFEGDWYFKLPWDNKSNPVLDLFRAQQEATTKTTEIREDRRRAAAPSVQKVASVRVLSPDSANPAVVHNGQKSVFRYHYANGTSTPIKIVNVHADCHCTSVAKEYPEVPPGGEGTIEVTLDTFGLPLGMIQKEIYVTFADLPEALPIRLSVENQANFLLDPASVDFGTVQQGTKGQSLLKIVNRSGRAVRIESHLLSDPNLAVSLPSESIPAGGTASLALTYVGQAAGEFLGSLMLKTDLAVEPLITVPVKGRVAP